PAADPRRRARRGTGDRARPAARRPARGDRRGGVLRRGGHARRGDRARPGDAVNERELNRATLARQLLLAREPLGVLEAVDRLGGLQAQEPRPPFIALWSRLEGF